MWSRHVGDICDLFSVFSCWSIYPNQLLVYLQNIPNLSTMCKCGLDNR